MKYSAVVVAAGSGTRMGLGFNKVYAVLDDGRTVLERTLGIFMDDPDCVQIVVVCDAGEFRKHVYHDQPGKIALARGGATRQESVANGLMAVVADTVMIHDGARPYLGAECLERLKKAMATEHGALLCVPCKDTVKHVENGYVIETYERNTIMAAQTPQAFRTKIILECMARSLAERYACTDDSSLLERYGYKVKMVEGSYANFKLTTPEDLAKAA